MRLFLLVVSSVVLVCGLSGQRRLWCRWMRRRFLGAVGPDCGGGQYAGDRDGGLRGDRLPHRCGRGSELPVGWRWT